MTYKIIGDSCLDITEEYRNDEHFQIVPLTLQVEDKHFIDDETFNQAEFLKAVSASSQCPKSACPSPDTYLQAYKNSNADMIFVITLSQHLSGSYNSAVLAKNMYEEEVGDNKKIEVISSLSASVGETLIALKIRELAEAGASFDEIVKKAYAFRDEMKTYFVLDSLETLRKNGRLTGIQAFFASALNIKPVMAGDKGTIVKLDQARGINKALGKMIDILIKDVPNTEEKILGIAHCNCPERANMVKNLFLEKKAFKDVYIVDTAGVSTMYANDGGIIVSC